MRIRFDKKGEIGGGNYIVKIQKLAIYSAQEAETEGAFFSEEYDLTRAYASSNNPPNTPEMALDGKVLNQLSTDYWSGAMSESQDGRDFYAVDLGEAKSVGRISLYPRIDGVGTVSVLNFPVGFTFVYSSDAKTWYAFEGGTVSGYTAVPRWNDFSFDKSANTRYVGVLITKLGTDPGNPAAFFSQFAGIRVASSAAEVGQPGEPLFSGYNVFDPPQALEKPTNLKINGNVLTWDAVPNASGYEVKIGDEVYACESNTYTITITEAGDYAVSVCAKGDSYRDSEYSASINYKAEGDNPGGGDNPGDNSGDNPGDNPGGGQGGCSGAVSGLGIAGCALGAALVACGAAVYVRKRKND